VKGKFIYAGDEKLYIRGVTYGTFRLRDESNDYPEPNVVDQDFTNMAANGINAIRTYTVPPRWLLDLAQMHGIRVMVGLPWEQHIAFLDYEKHVQAIEDKVRSGVSLCAGHPAVLCYTIGNEIPASIVRWHGHKRVERFLEKLYRTAKAEDPDGLVTYVNYPTTEYLQLPFLDVISYNVYLESQERLGAYLARLQNIAGERPLIMAEIGLDSQRHGHYTQARVLDWQIRTSFASGCAGIFVFAWTDEWHRGGYDIEDWDFGITSRERNFKPALASVRKAFTEVPFPSDIPWPFISVIVCTYNGARTIRDCLEALLKIEYPKFEVIVVNDGSNDETAAITKEYGFRLITVKNGGLSNARNIGLEAAKGEIVAYIDDDAYPDKHWLKYLANTFLRTTHVGIGGPNIAPYDDGLIADCVANSPGGPNHVLLSDQVAEHIPGCNMAFRKESLREIGGFDTQFRVAGDDVDVCWRLQEKGWTLGFSPSAVVWHHRRNSLRAYWRQQLNYGKAEALLERKWPGKYNRAGHVTWGGRLYGNGLTLHLGLTNRIYHGVWGNALFQSIYRPAPGLLQSLPLMPEWYLVIIALSVLSSIGILWTPLLIAIPLLFIAIGVPVAQAILSASRTSFHITPKSRLTALKFLTITSLLHLLQPFSRLCGRLSYGLTPWRRCTFNFTIPWPRSLKFWSERWYSSEKRLESIEETLRSQGVGVIRGNEYDRWDLEVRAGLFGTVRMLMAIEEHGSGKQLVRLRSWPRFSVIGITLTLLFSALSIGAELQHALVASVILGVIATLPSIRMLQECGGAMASALYAIKKLGTRL
jgi:GT2 family glycosyltransferase